MLRHNPQKVPPPASATLPPAGPHANLTERLESRSKTSYIARGGKPSPLFLSRHFPVSNCGACALDSCVKTFRGRQLGISHFQFQNVSVAGFAHFC